MNKVLITTDSTCDLSKEILDSRNIKVIPLYINLNEKSYKDGIDITTKEMYDLVEIENSHPKTSAPTVNDYYQFFKEYLEQGYDIVHTGISSTMSVSMNNAILAKEMLDENGEHIFIVDSGNLSTGIGLLVLKGCDFADKGLDAKTVKEKMEEVVPKIRSQFVVETLDYIHKGGRCSSVMKFIGNFIKLRLQIRVIDKVMKVVKKTIGPMRKAIVSMVNEYLDNVDLYDTKYVFITHSEAPSQATFIEHLIEPVKDKIENLYITEAGCVISSHCGSGCIGILYIEK